MFSPVLHLRHPRRAGRALCGLSLTAEEDWISDAVLSPTLSIEATGLAGTQPACRICLVGLLSGAFSRHGARLVTAFSAVTPMHLWTGTALRERREAAGLSCAAVARMAGLAEATVRNVETRDLEITRRVLYRLMSVARLDPGGAK